MDEDLKNEGFGGGFTRFITGNGQNQDQNAEANPSGFGSRRGGSGEEREIWLGGGGGGADHEEQEQSDLLDVTDPSFFYTDFLALPDFPCMSSSSSSTSSSTPPPPPPSGAAAATKPIVSVSSSSTSSASSSSAASWAVLKPDAEDIGGNNNHYTDYNHNSYQQQYREIQHHAGLKIESVSHDVALSSTESMLSPPPVQMIQTTPPSASNHEQQGGLMMDGDVDCIDVMEDFGCIDLLENNDIWDPSPLFRDVDNNDNDNDGNHDLGQHFLHQSQQQPQNSLLLDGGQLDQQQQQQEQDAQDALEQFMVQSSGSNNAADQENDAPSGTVLLDQRQKKQQGDHGEGDDRNHDDSEDISRMFFEWLKSNKESISAEDLRSIKIKKSTIECAAKRLGGGKQGMKQLLKLILEWIQTHLHNNKRVVRDHQQHHESIGGVSMINAAVVDLPPPFAPAINSNYTDNQIHQNPNSPSCTLNNPNLIVPSTPNPNPDNTNASAPVDPNPCFSPQSWPVQPMPPAPPPHAGYVSADPNSSMNPAAVIAGVSLPPHAPPTGFPTPMVGYMNSTATPDYYPTAAAYSNTHPNYPPPPPPEYHMFDTPQWPAPPPPQFAMPPPPLPSYGTPMSDHGTLAAVQPPPQYAGYGPPPAACGQYPYHQFFPACPASDHNGLVRLGSSATKEARKKRMARQRRFISHHNRNQGHHNSSSHQMMSQVGEQHSRMIEDNCNPAAAVQVNHGGWVYWPAAAAAVSGSGAPAAPPTMTGQMQHIVDTPPSCTAPAGNGNYQRQIAAAGTTDKKQGWKAEKNLRFLLQKVLKQSDVGNLGRIVLPKKEAETHLPELEARDGIPIAMEDIGTSRVWNMRYRFWPNNKSRMYLLENTGDFVRSNGLQEGDFIVIYSDVKCGKYMIRGVKVRPQQQGPKSSDANKKPAKVQKTQPLMSTPATASTSGSNTNIGSPTAQRP